MAFERLCFCFGFLLLADRLCVQGIITQPQVFDLVITSASRASERDGHDVTEYVRQHVTGMTYTVNFTASTRPEVKWVSGDPYNDMTIIPQESTRVEYTDGAGSASVSLSCERVADPLSCREVVRLFIGDFSTQFFVIDMHWNPEVPSDTQQLHTQHSRLYGVGYDVAYTPGESFDLMISTPVGTLTSACYRGLPQFSILMPQWGRPNDKFEDSYDYITNRTFTDSMTFTSATFDTKDIELGGYMKILTRYENSCESVPRQHFVVDKFQEVVIVTFHDEKDPGPFPANYKDVRVLNSNYDGSSVGCWKGTNCAILCTAYANYIQSFDFFRLEADGSRTKLPSKSDDGFPDVPHVSFIMADVFLDDHFDLSQTFSCQVTSEDGTTGETTFSITGKTFG